MADATHADWEYTMRVNFWGVVHGVETFVPRLLAQGQGGHIVNTASMAGLVGMEWLGVYCASKFAVVGLTRGARTASSRRAASASACSVPMIVQTDINRNSIRNRPAALRNPDHPSDPPTRPRGAGAMVGSVIGVDEVARRVVRAIDRGDLYVLTHPEQRAILRAPRRAASIACSSPIAGDGWRPPARPRSLHVADEEVDQRRRDRVVGVVLGGRARRGGRSPRP